MRKGKQGENTQHPSFHVISDMRERSRIVWYVNRKVRKSSVRLSNKHQVVIEVGNVEVCGVIIPPRRYNIMGKVLAKLCKSNILIKDMKAQYTSWDNGTKRMERELKIQMQELGYVKQEEETIKWKRGE